MLACIPSSGIGTSARWLAVQYHCVHIPSCPQDEKLASLWGTLTNIYHPLFNEVEAVFKGSLYPLLDSYGRSWYVPCQSLFRCLLCCCFTGFFWRSCACWCWWNSITSIHWYRSRLSLSTDSYDNLSIYVINTIPCMKPMLKVISFKNWMLSIFMTP